MSQKNMGRLAQDMKREVIAIIGRLKDPRLEGGLLTVTRLDVTPDLDVAKVYVSVMGREDGPKPAIAALNRAATAVAAPDGRCGVNTTGNPGPSRGGSGDALAGMTAALLACGLPAYEAAACAVYLHGAAADRAAALRGEYGMLPQDLFAQLGRLFAEHHR